MSRSLCVDERALDGAVREHAGEARMRVRHDALGLVGHHRRHAAPLAQSAGWPRASSPRRAPRPTISSGLRARARAARRASPDIGGVSSVVGRRRRRRRRRPARSRRPGSRGAPGPGGSVGDRAKRLVDRPAGVARRQTAPDHFVIGANSAQLIELLMRERAARADRVAVGEDDDRRAIEKRARDAVHDRRRARPERRQTRAGPAGDLGLRDRRDRAAPSRSTSARTAGRRGRAASIRSRLPPPPGTPNSARVPAPRSRSTMTSATVGHEAVMVLRYDSRPWPRPSDEPIRTCARPSAISAGPFPTRTGASSTRERAYPGRVRQGADRRGLSRGAHSRGVRRLRPRHRRSVDHPGGDQPQRRQRRRVPRADVHDGHAAAARLGRAEARVPAEDRDRRAAPAGVRRERADDRLRHHAAEDDGRSARATRYVVRGQKVWISRAEHSDLLLLVARTTPIDQVKKRTRRAVDLARRHARRRSATA